MKNNFRATVYACYFGYITQAVINNLAPLLFLIFRDSLGIPLSGITLLITVNFCVQLLVDYVSGKWVDRIGYRTSIVAAHIFAAVGLLMMGFAPRIGHPLAGLMAATVVYAIGGGLIEVLISPIVEACPTDNKASAMALLHSFYCWGTVAVIALSTLYLHLRGKDSWQSLAMLWAILPAVNAVVFCIVPINTLTGESGGMTPLQLARNGRFWLYFLLMLTAGASEQAMSQWASAFAESGLGVSKMVGDLLGPCMFAVLMGTARVLTSRLSGRVSINTMLISGGVLCAASYLLAAMAPTPVLGLVGCALCGLSVGAMWPGAFSMASVDFATGGTALFALLALAGDLGCMTGPTMVGELADRVSGGISTGLAVSIVFPISLSAICLVLKRRGKDH